MKNKLLAAGIAAGPLFISVSLTQAFSRDGFDLSRHPLSPLSLGDLGWVQIGNFVAAGALNVACAAACSIFTRTFIAAGKPGWAVSCISTIAAVLVGALWPDLSSISIRLVLATALQMGFVAALAARLGHGLPNTTVPARGQPVLAYR